MTGIDFELDGRRALVTGAGQGVGLGIARLLAEAGAHVLVNDFFPERADAAVEELRAAGGSAEALPFDVTDIAGVRAAIDGAGGCDVLVNNAGNAGTGGFGALTPFVDSDPADWERYFSVNLFGVMHCVHAALPRMIEQRWGRIVTMISDAGRIGEANMAAYAAAKSAAAGFCRGIAREVGRHGVTVNNVALGTMRTPLTSAVYDDPAQAELMKSILSGYLVRRPGEPEDAAWVVAMLASPRAAWVTGQTIPVNGGYSFTL